MTDGGERGIDILLSICPLPQKGQTVRSIPVNFFKSLIDDSLGTSLTDFRMGQPLAEEVARHRDGQKTILVVVFFLPMV